MKKFFIFFASIALFAMLAVGCKNTNGSADTLPVQIAKTFAVTITQPDNGTITATKDGKAFTDFAKVEHGTKLTFTLKANANYYAKKLSVNENEKIITNTNEAMQELQLEIKLLRIPR